MSDNNKSLSVADLIALLALAGLGVIEGFGLYLGGDGDKTVPIFGGLAFSIGFGLLLWLCKKAKSTKNNPETWRIVEIVCLVVYLVAGWFFRSEAMRFFAVWSNKTELANQATEELDNLETMYNQYDIAREEALANAITMLENFEKLEPKDRPKHDLYVKYYQPFNFDRSVTAEWDNITQLDDDLLDVVKERKSEVKSLAKFPKIALFLKEATDFNYGEKEKLQDKISNYTTKYHIIPRISYENNQYVFNGYFQFDHYLPSSSFMDALKYPTMASNSLILYILGHILILLSYLVTERGRFVGIKKKKGNIGGLPL